MPKFKSETIQTWADKYESNEALKHAPGTGLFNDATKAQVSGDFKIRHIPLEQLVPNELNEGFSMDEIEELKTSILEVGLHQNLVVKKVDDEQYKILTGHRRFQALQELAADGESKFKTAPCIVTDFTKIALPLSEASKEKYALATTNAEIRNNTATDRLKLMQMLSDVYDELKAEGYKGVGKRREFIAKELGVSQATVGIYSHIEQNLVNEFKEEFKNEKLALTTATEIAKLSSEEQQKLFVQTEDVGALSAADVKAFVEKTNKSERKASHGYYSMVSKDFDFFINPGFSIDMDDGITVTNKERERIETIKKQVEKQYAALEKILNGVKKRYEKE